MKKQKAEAKVKEKKCIKCGGAMFQCRIGVLRTKYWTCVKCGYDLKAQAD